jgi:hypothetical protein
MGRTRPGHHKHVAFVSSKPERRAHMLGRLRQYFLRAKAWQLFPFVVGLYFVGQLGAIAASTHPNRRIFAAMLMSTSVSPSLLWFWSMGTFFNSMVKAELRMPADFFHFALVYPALYFGLFMAKFTQFEAWLVPLHLAGMFCMFYALYFVAKNLVLAETEKPTSFFDYSGPFFLLWFFPFGIWVVQPRVNQLYAKQNLSSIVD